MTSAAPALLVVLTASRRPGVSVKFADMAGFGVPLLSSGNVTGVATRVRTGRRSSGVPMAPPQNTFEI